MEKTSGAPLLICDTVLRDMHRTQVASCLIEEDMQPALHALNEAGYYALECWSDTVLDYWRVFAGDDPGADPWRALEVMKAALPDVHLQMMVRTKKMLADDAMTDDALRTYCLTAIEKGIDIFRIYDADNDIKRLTRAGAVIKDYGATLEIAYGYHKGDTASGIAAYAKQAIKTGADILSVMDLNREMTTSAASEIVHTLKDSLRIPLNLRVRHDNGRGEEICLAASEAGVDIVDTSLSLFADRFSQPMTESILKRMQGKERDPGLDTSRIRQVADHLLKAAA